MNSININNPGRAFIYDKVQEKPDLVKKEINAFNKAINSLDNSLTIMGQGAGLTYNMFTHKFEKGICYHLDYDNENLIRNNHIIYLVNNFSKNLFTNPQTIEAVSDFLTYKLGKNLNKLSKFFEKIETGKFVSNVEKENKRQYLNSPEYKIKKLEEKKIDTQNQLDKIRFPLIKEFQKVEFTIKNLEREISSPNRKKFKENFNLFMNEINSNPQMLINYDLIKKYEINHSSILNFDLSQEITSFFKFKIIEEFQSADKLREDIQRIEDQIQKLKPIPRATPSIPVNAEALKTPANATPSLTPANATPSLTPEPLKTPANATPSLTPEPLKTPVNATPSLNPEPLKTPVNATPSSPTFEPIKNTEDQNQKLKPKSPTSTVSSTTEPFNKSDQSNNQDQLVKNAKSNVFRSLTNKFKSFFNSIGNAFKNFWNFIFKKNQ